MKKIPFVFLVLIITAVFAIGQPLDKIPNPIAPPEAIAGMIIQQSTPGGGACDTEVISNTATVTGAAGIGSSTFIYYAGQHSINLGSDTDICSVTFTLSLGAGSITGKTFTAYIYTIDGSDNLDTLQGTSDGITGSDAWSETSVLFEFSSAVTLTASTDYAAVIAMDEVDGSNFANTHYTASGEIMGLSCAWQASGTKTTDAVDDVRLTLYE